MVFVDVCKEFDLTRLTLQKFVNKLNVMKNHLRKHFFARKVIREI